MQFEKQILYIYNTVYHHYSSFRSDIVNKKSLELQLHKIILITKTRLFKYTENFTTKNFQIKNSDIFHISAHIIDCGYPLEPPHRGGSNKYPQSMFSSKNKKNNVYPCKPQFYCIKLGFKGVKFTCSRRLCQAKLQINMQIRAV